VSLDPAPGPTTLPPSDATVDDARTRAATLDAALSRLDLVTCAVEAAGAKVSLRKPRSAEALICEDDFADDERLPYWADVWPSSRALAGVLRGTAGTGRSLLELGCGVGLVSVTALRAGFTVTASDYYPDALEVARLNALRLAGDGDARLRTRHVDWRRLPEDLGAFDVVCAADVLYEPEYAQLVSATIARTLAATGEALVADPGRTGLAPFRAHMDTLGFREAESFTVLVPPDTASGELVQKARPGGSGMTPGAAGLPPAHKVNVLRYRRRA
jgi:predicted nicotinamide N-methyase